MLCRFDIFDVYYADSTFSDILSKHQSAHNAISPEVAVQPLFNGSVPRNSRACYACAKAREKCTRELPCVRCSRRCLDCVYPGRQQQDRSDRQSFEENKSSSRPPNTENTSAANAVLTPGTLQDSFEGHTLTAEMLDQIQNQSDKASDSSTTRRTIAIQNAPWSAIASFSSSDKQLPPMLTSNPSGSALWPLQNDGLESGVEVVNQPINWLPFDELVDPSLEYIQDETILLSNFDDMQWLSTNTSTAADGFQQEQSWNLHIPAVADTNNNESILDLSPPKGSISSTYKRGDLYATSSDGARNACSTRAKRDDILCTFGLPHTNHRNLVNTTSNNWVGFPDVENTERLDDGICNPAIAISKFTYGIILQHFKDIYPRMQSPLLFETESFPPLSLLNLFVKLYFKCFDPVLPFIHLPSLDMNKSWVLTIVIAAIGSHYYRSRDLMTFTSPLHEFCRRLLQQEFERCEEGMTDLPVLQARILNHIGLCYAESKKLDTVALSTWSFSVSLVNSQSQKHLLKYRNDSLGWNEWVEAESWRRLHFTTRV